ncbi:MAG: 50S ribosome-binding GTPase [Candidatus Shikimatogenerans bostrichidophilus]|nr:MAG: 50S ribosome-binding GTPase [Candidatus Shikimatogenerans bostrichidophilus]
MINNNILDNINIICKSGNGGHGCVHFYKTNKKIGKPDGGNGGNGGNIIFIGNKNLYTLYHLKFKKKYKASNGLNGMKNGKNGKNGKDLTINIPLNTVISYKDKKNNLIKDFIKYNNQKIVFLYGGKGGKGNKFYKRSYNQKAKKFQYGNKGKSLLINLKFLLKADIGIIGYPNTGKSTLLSKLTNKKPKIDNYNFTTITPNLGIYKTKFKNYLIIDFPAIIKNFFFKKQNKMGNKYIHHLKYNKIILIVLTMHKKIYRNYLILKHILNYYKIKIKKIILIISKTYLFKKKRNLILLKKKLKVYNIQYFIFNNIKDNINKLKNNINKFLFKN